MKYWQRKGISGMDVRNAIKASQDQKIIVMRLEDVFTGTNLSFFIPEYSSFYGELFPHSELVCLKDFLVDFLEQYRLFDEIHFDKVGQSSGKRYMDIVLNNGDLPLSRLVQNAPPFQSWNDRDVIIPVPVFSLATNSDFADILFPNFCRPAILHDSPEGNPFSERESILFWRGTDRGLVNWHNGFDAKSLATSFSLRKSIVEESHKICRSVSIHEDVQFDDTIDTIAWNMSPTRDRRKSLGNCSFSIELLEDDLRDSSIVVMDANYVDPNSHIRYKYLLDIRGNGYSGSFKRKLMSGSLVLPVLVQNEKDMYEHFYFGLSEDHLLPIHCEKIIAFGGLETNHSYECDLKFYSELITTNDEHLEKRVSRAVDYMKGFRVMTYCYLWGLLRSYLHILMFNTSREFNVPPTSNEATYEEYLFSDEWIRYNFYVKHKEETDKDIFSVEQCMKWIESESL